MRHLPVGQESAAGAGSGRCRTADQKGLTGFMHVLHSPAVVDQMAREKGCAAPIRQCEPFNHAFSTPFRMVGRVDGLNQVKTVALEVPMAPVGRLFILESEQRQGPILRHEGMAVAGGLDGSQSTVRPGGLTAVDATDC